MNWLKYTGCWFNFTVNPYHWIWDVDFGGHSFGDLVSDPEEREWFWVHVLLGPFNMRLVIDDGRYTEDDYDSDFE